MTAPLDPVGRDRLARCVELAREAVAAGVEVRGPYAEFAVELHAATPASG